MLSSSFSIAVPPRLLQAPSSRSINKMPKLKLCTRRDRVEVMFNGDSTTTSQSNGVVEAREEEVMSEETSTADMLPPLKKQKTAAESFQSALLGDIQYATTPELDTLAGPNNVYMGHATNNARSDALHSLTNTDKDYESKGVHPGSENDTAKHSSIEHYNNEITTPKTLYQCEPKVSMVRKYHFRQPRQWSILLGHSGSIAAKIVALRHAATDHLVYGHGKSRQARMPANYFLASIKALSADLELRDPDSLTFADGQGMIVNNFEQDLKHFPQASHIVIDFDRTCTLEQEAQNKLKGNGLEGRNLIELECILQANRRIDGQRNGFGMVGFRPNPAYECQMPDEDGYGTDVCQAWGKAQQEGQEAVKQALNRCKAAAFKGGEHGDKKSTSQSSTRTATNKDCRVTTRL